jgi:hypothetical protein
MRQIGDGKKVTEERNRGVGEGTEKNMWRLRGGYKRRR